MTRLLTLAERPLQAPPAGDTMEIGFTKTKNKTNSMKIKKKKQDDRLLKQLSRADRKQQELLRQLIRDDPLFKTV